MPQGVRGGMGLAILQIPWAFRHSSSRRGPTDMLARQIAGKGQVFTPFRSQPLSQDLQQLGGEHSVAISLPLPCSTRPTMRLLSMAGGVRAMASEDAQAGGVAGGQLNLDLTPTAKRFGPNQV